MIPFQPTIAGYQAFLYGNVQIPQKNLPPVFVGAGTLEQGSTTLTIVNQQQGQLAQNVVVVDANGALGWDTTIIQQLTGSPPGAAGTYELSGPAGTTQSTAELITAPNAQALMTLAIALHTVNETIAGASPQLYTLAVYNLAADRLLNYGVDVPGQTFFKDLREKLKLTSVSVGVASSANDQGTSVGILNPEQLKSLTMMDLQTLKTSYGREYMGIVQAYGPVIWGLS